MTSRLQKMRQTSPMGAQPLGGGIFVPWRRSPPERAVTLKGAHPPTKKKALSAASTGSGGSAPAKQSESMYIEFNVGLFVCLNAIEIDIFEQNLAHLFLRN